MKADACSNHAEAAINPVVSLSVWDKRPITDTYGRTIDHLRLSVTSACNLRCLYCRPGSCPPSCRANLTDDQRLDLVSHLYSQRGLRQLRLTGGEPLLHGSIVDLVARIRQAAPDLSLAMTTNGLRLAPMARDLKAAGLDRLNVSLDTTNPTRYRALTGGCVDDVISGLRAAVDAGFPYPRLNTVVLSGYNDECLVEIASWAMDRCLEIRFLEAMPIGPAADFNRMHFVPERTIRRRLESHFQLSPLPPAQGETAARFVARSPRHSGVIGIIAPISRPFCGQCRRMRLTADGLLFPCLLDSRRVDLSPCWNRGAFHEMVADELIATAAADKKPTGSLLQETAMINLGG